MRHLLFAALLLGCSSSNDPAPSNTTPANDAASDVATTDDAASDAADGTATDTSTCDVGAPPATVPSVTSEFLIVKGDAGVAVPTPTGGDATGTWTYSKMTVYLAEAAEGQVDPAKSKIEGTGWVVHEATAYRTAVDTVTTLETTLAGTVIRGTTTKSKGTWAMEGSNVVYTPECAESTADSKSNTFGWSRVDDDHAKLFVPAGSGPTSSMVLAIVADLVRVK